MLRAALAAQREEAALAVKHLAEQATALRAAGFDSLPEVLVAVERLQQQVSFLLCLPVLQVLLEGRHVQSPSTCSSRCMSVLYLCADTRGRQRSSRAAHAGSCTASCCRNLPTAAVCPCHYTCRGHHPSCWCSSFLSQTVAAARFCNCPSPPAHSEIILTLGRHSPPAAGGSGCPGAAPAPATTWLLMGRTLQQGAVGFVCISSQVVACAVIAPAAASH